MIRTPALVNAVSRSKAALGRTEHRSEEGRALRCRSAPTERSCQQDAAQDLRPGSNVKGYIPAVGALGLYGYFVIGRVVHLVYFKRH
jgi:hypothetical protein